MPGSCRPGPNEAVAPGHPLTGAPVTWQINELGAAVERARENPEKFNLNEEEVSSRAKWVENTRKQVGEGRCGPLLGEVGAAVWA